MPKSKTLTKSLRYSVITKIVNFNPSKFNPRTIIVNGAVAIHLKGRVYTKI